MTNKNRAKILRAVNQWCEHDLDDCGMRRTRYDNCLCRQQAGSVVDALKAQSFLAKVGRIARFIQKEVTHGH